MADLKELQETLRSAIADGGQHKVFFYAAKDKGAGLRHGFIAVIDGKSCQINFEQLDNERALNEIARLKFIKVQNLPMLDQNPAVGSNPLLNAAFVLKRIDPDQPPAGDAGSVDSGSADAGSAYAGSGRGNPVADAIAALAPPANVMLSHMRLKEAATALLETYYGHSAPQKVAEAEAKFPPETRPVEFLNACRQSAAVLVGMPKATEVFKGLYDTLG
ncbi:MAG: hypothetical protein IT473_10550 [Lysobacter sp.]|nr:hypothetical protein [Lysobacter sp.]